MLLTWADGPAAYNAALSPGLCSGGFLPFDLQQLWSLPVFISSAFAQTAPAAAGGGDMLSSLTGMLPLVLMFVVLYFVMIRPQMKKQKEHRAMIDALAKGDEVATAGGLLGKVTKLGDSYLTLELTAGVEVQLQRSAIVQVLPKGAINTSK
jgi:preprotein translocase subunit YajC